MMGVVRFRSWRGVCGLGSALAASFPYLALPALADEPLPAPIVAWAVPTECPNAESIVQRLMALGNGSAHGFAGGAVRGEVVKESDEWVLSLQIAPGAPSGVVDAAAAPARVLRAHDCDDLADAGAVAIAIALGGGGYESDAPVFAPRSAPASIGAVHLLPGLTPIAPSGVDVRSLGSGDLSSTSAGESASGKAPVAEVSVAEPTAAEPAAAEPAAAEPTAADEPPEADEPTAPKEKPSKLGFAPSAGLLFDATSLGGAAFGPSAELEVRWAAFGVGAYGLWLPPREISVAAEQSVELSLLSAGLRGCYRAADALPIIDICAGSEFGALNAAGKGLVQASRRRDPWGAATGGVLLGVDLGGLLRAGARVDAVLPLLHERYLVNQNELVHEVPGASVRLALLLAGSFGKR
jgi:hypothetical protein